MPDLQADSRLTAWAKFLNPYGAQLAMADPSARDTKYRKRRPNLKQKSRPSGEEESGARAKDDRDDEVDSPSAEAHGNPPDRPVLETIQRCFNPDERVSPTVLRRVGQPFPARANPVHLFAAYHDGRLAGGPVTLVLPAFQVVFGSYIFVAPEMRGRGLGTRILREVLRQERGGLAWRMYGEVTPSSGARWRRALAQAGFRFFAAKWPLVSYDDPDKVLAGRLCYFPFRANPPARFSQPAMLAYVHALFYGP